MSSLFPKIMSWCIGFGCLLLVGCKNIPVHPEDIFIKERLKHGERYALYKTHVGFLKIQTESEFGMAYLAYEYVTNEFKTLERLNEYCAKRVSILNNSRAKALERIDNLRIRVGDENVLYNFISVSNKFLRTGELILDPKGKLVWYQVQATSEGTRNADMSVPGEIFEP